MTTLRETDVLALPWQVFDGVHGVRHKVLWSDPRGPSYAGLISMQPAAVLDPHTHGHAAHHVWVAEGTCTVDGSALDEGSYSFVPPGREHGVEAGPSGCVLFYLYVHPDEEAA